MVIHARDEWHYLRPDGTRQGPISLASLLLLTATGDLNESTSVWHHGLDDWLPLALAVEPQALKVLQPEIHAKIEQARTQQAQSFEAGNVLRDGKRGIGIVGGVWYTLVLVIAAGILVIALPYQLINGNFRVEYVGGIVLWVVALHVACTKLFGTHE